MEKRILIPTDFSENALNAARYALQLYGKHEVRFYFLHAFHPENYTTEQLYIPDDGGPEYERAKAGSEEGLKRFMELLEPYRDESKHEFIGISRFSFLYDAIMQIITRKDIELVVMGTKGSSALKGVIFGSNTVMAMERIRECPVLAIPEDYKYVPLRELVFPTDFKDGFKRLALNGLLEIAGMHGAAIRVVHVSKKEDWLNADQQEHKALLDDILGELEHSYHTLTGPDVSEAITSFVDNRGSDMIAFINHKHFFFGTVFRKPLVKEIGYAATVPLLALH